MFWYCEDIFFSFEFTVLEMISSSTIKGFRVYLILINKKHISVKLKCIQFGEKTIQRENNCGACVPSQHLAPSRRSMLQGWRLAIWRISFPFDALAPGRYLRLRSRL